MFEYICGCGKRYASPSTRTCYTVSDRVVALVDIGDGVVSLEVVEHSDAVEELYFTLSTPCAIKFTLWGEAASYTREKSRSLETGGW